MVRTTLLLLEEVPLGDQPDRRRERRVGRGSRGGDDRSAVGLQRIRTAGSVDEFAFRRRSYDYPARRADFRDRIARYRRTAANPRRRGGVSPPQSSRHCADRPGTDARHTMFRQSEPQEAENLFSFMYSCFSIHIVDRDNSPPHHGTGRKRGHSMHWSLCRS